MSTVLGLIGFVLFIPAIIGMAAGITWVVVKISPPGMDRQPKPEG